MGEKKSSAGINVHLSTILKIWLTILSDSINKKSHLVADISLSKCKQAVLAYFILVIFLYQNSSS